MYELVGRTPPPVHIPRKSKMGCMGLGGLAGSFFCQRLVLQKRTWKGVPLSDCLVDTGVTSQEFSLFQQLVSGPTFLGECPHVSLEERVEQDEQDVSTVYAGLATPLTHSLKHTKLHLQAVASHTVSAFHGHPLALFTPSESYPPTGGGTSRNAHVPYLGLEPAFLPLSFLPSLSPLLLLLALGIKPRALYMPSKQALHHRYPSPDV